jgi:hypothetical protein
MPEKTVAVRMTLDDEIGAAYIYLAEKPRLGWRHGKTVVVPTDEIGGATDML